MKKIFETKGGRYGLYAVLAAVFLLLYSPATSPLAAFRGADSAFFTLVGRGMKEGLLPYRDFFDMKGPYFFFIEYVGQWPCTGKVGAFLIQLVNLFWSFCIIDGIYGQVVRPAMRQGKEIAKWLLIGVLPCLFVMAFTFERGNLTEEFSLVPLLLTLQYGLRYLRGDSAKHPLKYGFFYGLVFGFFALFRVTNATLVGAVLLTVSVCLIYKKEFFNLLYNGLMFLAGVCVAALPAVLFFHSQHLLQEMVEQVFLFGFTYASEQTLLQKFLQAIQTQWPIILCMALPVFCAFWFKTDWRHRLFSVSSFALLLLAVSMGNGYMHYFTLGIPHLVFGLVLLAEEKNYAGIVGKRRFVVPAVCGVLVAVLLPSFVYASGACVYKCLGLDGEKERVALVREIKDEIPEDAYDSVYVYGMSSCSNWYENAGLLPANRYCDWQDHYMQMVPEIEEELVTWFATDGPRYVVTSSEEPPENERLCREIENHYKPCAENALYVLYERVA